MQYIDLYAARQRMRAVYMQQDRGRGHATIITCIIPPYISFVMGLRMLLLLHAYIYTTLVSLLFGTVILTSFNILVEMFLLPCHILELQWSNHIYRERTINQFFDRNLM